MTGIIVKLRRYTEATADRVLEDCGAIDGGRRLPELGFFRALVPDDKADEVVAKLKAHPAVRPIGTAIEAGLTFHGLAAYQKHSDESAIYIEVYPLNSAVGATYAFHFPVDGTRNRRLHAYQASSTIPSYFTPNEGYAEGSDYSVSLNADQGANPGGVVTFLVSVSLIANGQIVLTNCMRTLAPWNCPREANSAPALRPHPRDLRLGHRPPRRSRSGVECAAWATLARRPHVHGPAREPW
jgi:hypothetical protein